MTDSNFARYKYMFGELVDVKNKFDNLVQPTNLTDGNLICANKKFVAVSIF